MKRSLLFIAGLVLIAAICEIYFRYFFILTDTQGFTLSTKKWMEKYVKLNNEGFRDSRDFVSFKPPGVFRVGILGDSFVYGLGINNPKDRFSHILERLISDTYHIKCEVYNMGQCGWSTVDETTYFLKKGSTLNLDALVVSCLNLDDFFTSISLPEWKKLYYEIQYARSIFFPIKRFLLENSYAASFFYGQYSKLYVSHHLRSEFKAKTEACISKDDNWVKFMNYISRIKMGCDSNGTQFYLVAFPFIRTVSETPLAALEEKYERLLRAYLEKYEIKYLFLHGYFDKHKAENLAVSVFDAHPNERANIIAAEALFAMIKPQLEMFLEKNHERQYKLTRKSSN